MSHDPDGASVMHEKYLPVTESQLIQHFAPVGGAKSAKEAKLQYYRNSLKEHRDFLARRKIPKNEQLKATARGLQFEKDERFWVVSALLGAYYPEQGRVDRLARLLRRALGDVPPFEDFATWEEALDGELSLYFEATLPSPPTFREWLASHLEERNFVPHLLEAGKKAGTLSEGRTWVDAVLVAPATGVGVLFEAKVLSDISTHISYDVMRNQIARNIDVMLDQNPKLAAPLEARRPELSCFVLLTPRMFKDNPHSRLYGWLLPEYQAHPEALARDLPHRESTDWPAVSRRLGWLTYEDCKEITPASCAWLPDPS